MKSKSDNPFINANNSIKDEIKLRQKEVNQLKEQIEDERKLKELNEQINSLNKIINPSFLDKFKSKK